MVSGHSTGSIVVSGRTSDTPLCESLTSRASYQSSLSNFKAVVVLRVNSCALLPVYQTQEAGKTIRAQVVQLADMLTD